MQYKILNSKKVLKNAFIRKLKNIKRLPLLNKLHSLKTEGILFSWGYYLCFQINSSLQSEIEKFWPLDMCFNADIKFWSKILELLNPRYKLLRWIIQYCTQCCFYWTHLLKLWEIEIPKVSGVCYVTRGWGFPRKK